MKISIAQRYRPFSHLPGTSCMLPGSHFRFQFFPTRIVFDDISRSDEKKFCVFDLDIKGPPRDFTVQQDLERGRLIVWGHYKEGFVRYRITSGKDRKSFNLEVEKCPEKGIRLLPLDKIVKRNGTVVISENKKNNAQFEPLNWEPASRLSLGSHKVLDWDLVKRRLDLAEILPIWHRLGICYPSSSFSKAEGNLEFLQRFDRLFTEKNVLDIYELFQNLFLAGFSGILSPQLVDSLFQGFDVKTPSKDFGESPLFLLSEGAKRIERLFISKEDNRLSFLPCLPPQFHSGRITDYPCAGIGQIDLEWSKKTIRRIIMRSEYSGLIHLQFQKGIKSYRVRTAEDAKGKRMSVEASLPVEMNKVYFLDNFQK